MEPCFETTDLGAVEVDPLNQPGQLSAGLASCDGHDCLLGDAGPAEMSALGC